MHYLFKQFLGLMLIILLSGSSCVIANKYKNHSSLSQKGMIVFKDVAPIINRKCMNCHSGDKTLINFSDYESIYGRRGMIKYTIENDLMPLWSATKHIGEWKNDLSLTSEEKQMLLKWLDFRPSL